MWTVEWGKCLEKKSLSTLLNLTPRTVALCGALAAGERSELTHPLGVGPSLTLYSVLTTKCSHNSVKLAHFIRYRSLGLGIVFPVMTPALLKYRS